MIFQNIWRKNVEDILMKIFLQIFWQYYFHSKDFTNIVRLFLAALGINRLKWNITWVHQPEYSTVNDLEMAPYGNYEYS